MKVRTSITLPRELLDAIDARTGRGHSRSEFIEAAVKAFLKASMRSARNGRDRAIRFDPAKHAIWQARGAGKRPVRWVDEFLARDRSAR